MTTDSAVRPGLSRLAQIALLAVCAVLPAVAAVVVRNGPAEFVRPSNLALALVTAIGLAFSVGGLVTWAKRPESRIGPLMMAYGLTRYAWTIGWIDSSLPYTAGYLLQGIYQPILGHLIVAFPSGRLRSRVDHLLVWIIYGSWAADAVARMAFYDPTVGCRDCPANLLLVHSNLSWADAVAANDGWGSVPLILAVFVVVINHLFKASAAERRALWALLWTAGPFAIVNILNNVPVFYAYISVSSKVQSVSLLLVCAGLLIGVLRYDSDRTAASGPRPGTVDDRGELPTAPA